MQIFIKDDLAPEATAMLQALYSRSPKSVVEHVAKVNAVGADKFMAQYYVGYGHQSIGDCGTTTIFIEGISLLAAKAIQSHPLYNGQEASTRYMDFSVRECVSPVLGTRPFRDTAKDLQQAWIDLSSEVQRTMVAHYTAKYACPSDDKGEFAKTVQAKAFDVARGFLPAGVTTNVSWHVNLRQAQDHIDTLLFHPLAEVRLVAKEVMFLLQQQYPSSFNRTPRPATMEYIDQTFWEVAPKVGEVDGDFERWFSCRDELFDFGNAQRQSLLWRNRPPRAPLPRSTDMLGRLEFRFMLDFGSFRDLQRHRSCLIAHGDLEPATTHSWYLSALCGASGGDILALRAAQLQHDIQKYFGSDRYAAYYCPLATLVPVVMQCSLNSAVYIAELRSGQTVHPTLRKVAQQMAAWLGMVIPGMSGNVHADMSPDQWSLKRGTQDITEIAPPTHG